MNDISVIAVLPVGELDNSQIKTQYESILGIFNHPGMELITQDPVGNEEDAKQWIRNLTKKKPDLLVIIPLRGLSAQTIEAVGLLSPVPVLIWPVQGRFALPSSVLAMGALEEAKVPVELLYIPPNHPDATPRLLPIHKAAKAYSRLRNSRIGVIGSLFPNLVSCRYDPKTIKEKIGVELLPISFDEIRSSMQSIKESSPELEQLRNIISNTFRVGALDGNALDAGLILHLVLKQMTKEKDLAGFATECWSAFPRELGLNPCLGFIEDAYSLACEGDVMLCISLLIVRYMTGINAYAGDLFDLDMDGILTLTHCGGPASITSSKDAVVLGKSQLALERGFETLTCRPRLELGPVTIFRFYGQECDKLHLAFGDLIGCEQSPNLTVKVKIAGNRQDFLGQCRGNHYLVVPGDIRTEIKLLSKWLGITIFET